MFLQEGLLQMTHPDGSAGQNWLGQYVQYTKLGRSRVACSVTPLSAEHRNILSGLFPDWARRILSETRDLSRTLNHGRATF